VSRQEGFPGVAGVPTVAVERSPMPRADLGARFCTSRAGPVAGVTPVREHRAEADCHGVSRLTAASPRPLASGRAIPDRQIPLSVPDRARGSGHSTLGE
jgi:hypothetical protein